MLVIHPIRIRRIYAIWMKQRESLSQILFPSEQKFAKDSLLTSWLHIWADWLRGLPCNEIFNDVKLTFPCAKLAFTGLIRSMSSEGRSQGKTKICTKAIIENAGFHVTLVVWSLLLLLLFIIFFNFLFFFSSVSFFIFSAPCLFTSFLFYYYYFSYLFRPGLSL